MIFDYNKYNCSIIVCMTFLNLKTKENFYQQKIIAFQNHPVMTEDLLTAYKEVLTYSHVPQALQFRNISIYQKQYIHQLFTKSHNKLPHLVCLHGFGATSLAYLHMFQHLKDHFQVHAIDNFGMGLSSRGDWKDDKTPQEVIAYFVEAIQAWRKQINLQSFILVGHSFGGYIAANYAEKYSSRIQHIVFLSAAGVSDWTEEEIKQKADQGRSYFTCFGKLGFNMNLRPAKMVKIPCLGNIFLTKSLKDKLKLQDQQLNAWKKFVKLISAQDDTSEQGFYKCIGWPDSPTSRSIQQILNNFKHTFHIDFFNGDDDWMNLRGPTKLSEQFKNISMNMITKAGHQLIFDNPKEVATKMKQKIYKNYQ